MLAVKERTKTKLLTRVSLLSGIAFLLVYLEFPLGIFPSWLMFDFSDIPALIGAFAMGPVVGIVIELVKNLLKILIKGTQTGGIGELANFIIGSSFVVTAGLIYHKKKTFTRAIVAMVTATVAMAAFGIIMNYYVLLPFFDQFMPGIAAQRNTIVMTIILPFNLLKGTIICLITIPLYKKIANILHK